MHHDPAAGPLALSRRRLCLGLAGVAIAGCQRAAHGQASLPALPVNWRSFAARFVTPEGRVVDNGNKGRSHSEGQGYGLLFALWAKDRAAFAAMDRWTSANLLRSDVALHAWAWEPAQDPHVADRNPATDGDVLIAWALGEGAKLWSNRDMAARAAAIRAAIRSRLVADAGGLTLLTPGLEGFRHDDGRLTVNPSYYVWPALDAFAALAPGEGWGKVIADGEAFLTRARFGPRQLPADWVDVAPDGALAPARDKPAVFGYDAVRVPLYAQGGRRCALAAPVTQFWQDSVRATGSVPASADLLTGAAPGYPAAEGQQAVAAALLGLSPPPALSETYYHAALQLLARRFGKTACRA